MSRLSATGVPMAFVTTVILVLALAVGQAHPLALVILGFSLFITLWALALCVTVQGQRLYSIIILLYLSILFVVPGMFHCARGVFPFFSQDYADADVTAAALLTSLFCCGFGAVVIRNAFSPTAEKKLDFNGLTKAPISTVAILYLGSIGISLTGFFLLGGASHFLASLREVAEARANIAADPIALVPESITRVAGFIALCLSMDLLRRRDLLIPIRVICFSLGIVIFFLVNRPDNVTRYATAGYAIALLVYRFEMSAFRSKAIFVSSFVAGVALVFPFLSNFSRGERGAALFENPLDRYITSGDFDGFQSVINVYRLTSSAGLSLGSHLVSSVLSFIPRQVWAGKEVPTGVEAAKFSGYLFVNISAPLPSEAYRDFSWPGVLAAAILIGLLVERLERRLGQTAERGLSLKRLGHGVAIGLLAIILRGSLQAVSAAVGAQIIFTLSVIWLAYSGGRNFKHRY